MAISESDKQLKRFFHYKGVQSRKIGTETKSRNVGSDAAADGHPRDQWNLDPGEQDDWAGKTQRNSEGRFY